MSGLRLVLIILVVTWKCSAIDIRDGGYVDVVLEISSEVKEDPKLIERIQELLTNTSHFLFQAMRGTAYFKEVKIAIPSNWSMTASVTESPDVGYRHADVRIIQDSDSSLAPYTRHTKGCGESGEYIVLATSFLQGLAHDTPRHFGDPGKVMVHEWAHFRYGVFDEVGDPNDPRFPPHYVNDQGQVVPTVCSVHEMKGRYLEMLTGQMFVPDEVQNTSASIMSYPYFATSFCDDTDENRHNKEAPTAQNYFCGNRSVWDVIRGHPDFQGKKSITVHPEQTRFVIVKSQASDSPWPRNNERDFTLNVLPRNPALLYNKSDSTAKKLVDILEENRRRQYATTVLSELESSTFTEQFTANEIWENEMTENTIPAESDIGNAKSEIASSTWATHKGDEVTQIMARNQTPANSETSSVWVTTPQYMSFNGTDTTTPDQTDSSVQHYNDSDYTEITTPVGTSIITTESDESDVEGGTWKYNTTHTMTPDITAHEATTAETIPSTTCRLDHVTTVLQETSTVQLDHHTIEVKPDTTTEGHTTETQETTTVHTLLELTVTDLKASVSACSMTHAGRWDFKMTLTWTLPKTIKGLKYYLLVSTEPTIIINKSPKMIVKENETGFGHMPTNHVLVLDSSRFDLSANTDYFVAVQAVDDHGVFGGLSNVVEVNVRCKDQEDDSVIDILSKFQVLIIVVLSVVLVLGIICAFLMCYLYRKKVTSMRKGTYNVMLQEIA